VTESDEILINWHANGLLLCICMFDADAETSSDDEKPVVTVDTWLKQAEVKMTFECQEVTSNGYTYLRSVFQLYSIRFYAPSLQCCHLSCDMCKV